LVHAGQLSTSTHLSPCGQSASVLHAVGGGGGGGSHWLKQTLLHAPVVGSQVSVAQMVWQVSPFAQSASLEHWPWNGSQVAVPSA
jgi:hypothetical protein